MAKFGGAPMDGLTALRHRLFGLIAVEGVGSFQCDECTIGRLNMSEWVDPDDAPVLTKEMAEIGQINHGRKVIRPATGYIGEGGKVVRTAPFEIPVFGRPPERDEAKKQVTLRLDADLLERFRTSGRGWQTRLNATLRKAVGM
jgi:BrnA antitoxin of type II toxin-antitoxin system